MPDCSQHLSSEEILQLIDLELPRPKTAHAIEHLAACPECRERRKQMEGKLGELSGLYQAESTKQSGEEWHARTRLKRELSRNPKQPSQRSRYFPIGVLPYAAVACLLVVAISLYVRGHTPGSSKPLPAEAAREPNRALTPGAVRPVTLSQICSSTDDDLDPALPGTIRSAVFDEYGIGTPGSGQSYQIDYLINPQLGGTSDIKNLWPQPEHEGVWSAREKDVLEKHLHVLVCERRVDLAVAQREIATDWIAAYRKYIFQPTPGRT